MKDTSRSTQEIISDLEYVSKAFSTSSTIQEKDVILDDVFGVISATDHSNDLKRLLKNTNPHERYLIKCFLAIGQAPILFSILNKHDPKQCLESLFNVLNELEKSYDVIGGIIGYQLNVLKIIANRNSSPTPDHQRFYHPPGFDLSQDTPETRLAIRHGIDSIGKMAEIYPVGGAGDRLNLHDERSGEALPAAELAFCGRTLLEGLIRDLQAKEYLYFKLHGKQVVTPVALMTSNEKNNDNHIRKIFGASRWFGRPVESFHFFVQPLVPMISKEGIWITTDACTLMLKPGGHGVIWKLMTDSGILDTLLAQGYTKALVRQINNPIAGIDYGLIAFTGWGIQKNKKFGFASCPRLLNTSEGMDVLVETEKEEGVEYRISNIEYTEFECQGIRDVPAVPGSPYSLYPANTNILFVDLEYLKPLISKAPIPGMLINMKTKVQCVDENGQSVETVAGRLESTMQNISDYIVDSYPQKLKNPSPDNLRTFVTYNDRRKTISVTKKAYTPENSLSETPEGCFYDLLYNNAELLTQYCGFTAPPVKNEVEYQQKGPSYIALLHPAVGPLFSIIAQKIRGGTIAEGSELILEIAELDIDQLNLQGSLVINAASVVGSPEPNGVVQYGIHTGKCVLKNTTIRNKGIALESVTRLWKGAAARSESCSIQLEGNGEFYADGVELEGNIEIHVPDGHRMVVTKIDGVMNYCLEKLPAPSWFWSYQYTDDNCIRLEKKSSK